MTLRNTSDGFRDICGYEGLYKVNRNGDVYSVRRGKVLTPKISKAGYYRVTLCRGISDHRTVGVHRLVAEAFIDNPDGKQTVNHINEVKTDNRVENLEWATTAEQNAHGTRIARAMAHTDWVARNRKTDYNAAAQKHDYGRQDMCNRKMTAAYFNDQMVGLFHSQREAAKACGVSVSRVSGCVSGNVKSCKGYKFKNVQGEHHESN